MSPPSSGRTRRSEIMALPRASALRSFTPATSPAMSTARSSSALSIEESGDAALIRMICAEPDFCRELLQTAGFPFCESELLAVETPLENVQPMLSICGGKASCGTCRVHVEPPWQECVGLPSRTERNLLNCLAEAEPGDRLACQILLTPGLDGLAIRLPVSA